MSEQPTSTLDGAKPPGWFWETFHRTAQVVIRNNTSSDLVGASIAHKYSNDYKDHGSWGIIKPGECSSLMTVNYTTGDLTTGRDWWCCNLQLTNGSAIRIQRTLETLSTFWKGKHRLSLENWWELLCGWQWHEVGGKLPLISTNSLIKRRKQPESS